MILQRDDALVANAATSNPGELFFWPHTTGDRLNLYSTGADMIFERPIRVWVTRLAPNARRATSRMAS